MSGHKLLCPECGHADRILRAHGMVCKHCGCGDLPKELAGGERVMMVSVGPEMKPGLTARLGDRGLAECVQERAFAVQALVLFDGDDDPWWVNVERLKLDDGR